MERDMFDTMTMTKILGAFCGTFLVFLLGGWAAEIIYHVGGSGHGDHAEQAYTIEVEGDDQSDEPEETFDVAALVAAADLGAGETVFARKCAACHKAVEAVNGTGPHLNGVVGRDVSAIGDYGYSGSLVAVVDVWSEEALFDFLENPKAYAPGTAMGFSGLGKPGDRADVIAYLSSITN
jgi:cytochrome c